MAKIDVEYLIEHQLRAVEDNRRMGFEAYVSVGKWMLATLLALNSGGLIAVLNAEELGSRFASAVCFYIGIMIALGLGWHTQWNLKRSFEALKHYELFLRHVQATGKLDQELGDALSESIHSQGRWTRRALHAGCVISFSAGLFAAIFGLPS